MKESTAKELRKLLEDESLIFRRVPDCDTSIEEHNRWAYQYYYCGAEIYLVKRVIDGLKVFVRANSPANAINKVS